MRFKYWLGWFLFVFGAALFALCVANILFSFIP